LSADRLCFPGWLCSTTCSHDDRVWPGLPRATPVAPMTAVLQLYITTIRLWNITAVMCYCLTDIKCDYCVCAHTRVPIVRVYGVHTHSHTHTRTHATDIIRRPNSSSGAGAYYIRVFRTYIYVYKCTRTTCVRACERARTGKKNVSDWSAGRGRATVADDRWLAACDVQHGECAGKASERERGGGDRCEKKKNESSIILLFNRK
jgi:hypothetical protein